MSHRCDVQPLLKNGCLWSESDMPGWEPPGTEGPKSRCAKLLNDVLDAACIKSKVDGNEPDSGHKKS